MSNFSTSLGNFFEWFSNQTIGNISIAWVHNANDNLFEITLYDWLNFRLPPSIWDELSA